MKWVLAPIFKKYRLADSEFQFFSLGPIDRVGVRQFQVGLRRLGLFFGPPTAVETCLGFFCCVYSGLALVCFELFTCVHRCFVCANLIMSRNSYKKRPLKAAELQSIAENIDIDLSDEQSDYDSGKV